MQFNPHRPELLATCGAKGELYITDLSNEQDSYRLGATIARADDFETLDWNKKVAHILATGSNGGYVTVWDVKAKKESLTLNNNGRKPVSAVAWNPDVSTKLATAIPNDSDPLVLLWDLRNSSAPEIVLRAHDLGVLALSWCSQDNSLLLSSGKDNRTICWNTTTGQPFGEFPIVSNWTFSTKWCPQHPSMVASASLDGKIVVQTIQATNTKTDESSSNPNLNVDGEDFFAKAQTQPQGTSFSLERPPKWLRRPVGASFAFGGKFVTLRLSSQRTNSEVQVVSFDTGTDIESSIDAFEQALQQQDLNAICSVRGEHEHSVTRPDDWKVMQALLADNQRKSLLAYLGFDQEVRSATPEVNGSLNDKKESKVVEIDRGADDGASFFDGDTKGAESRRDPISSKSVRNGSHFEVFSDSESDADKKITKALLMGRFELAVDVCLEEKRMADAFMIAVCGGQKCIDKAQAAYFEQYASGPSYARLLHSVVDKNLWDVVHNADLKDWAQVMASLCTYADVNEFGDLCEALGDRLKENAASRKSVVFCYLAGSKLEKVVPIWLREMQTSEQRPTEERGDDSEYSIHVKSLQAFIEKVSIFRRVINFEDKEMQLSNGWRLEPLYRKYMEYSEVVAGNGHLDLATKYLDFLPIQYPTAQAARDRIKQASSTAELTTSANQRKVNALTAAGPSTASGSALPYAAGFPSVTAAQRPADSRYAPPNGTVNAAAPSGFQSLHSQTGLASSAYGPPSAYAPPTPIGNPYQPTAQNFGVPPSASGANVVTTSSKPPPPRPSDDMNWNDLPASFTALPNTSRRGTPGPGSAAATMPLPYAPHSGMTSPPMAPPSFLPRQPVSLAPPPKAGQALPHVASPPAAQLLQSTGPSQQPFSSAANSYAPPTPLPPSNPYATSTAPSRGSTPYNVPPANGSAPSRYAPTAASGYTPSAPAYGAPPPRQIAPQPTVYGPPPASTQTNNIYATGPVGPPRQQAPPSAPPMSRPPPSSIPPPPQSASGFAKESATTSRPPTAESQRSATPITGKAGMSR